MSLATLRATLRRSVDARSSRQGEKVATHRAQLVSALVFVLLGVASIGRPAVALLFWSEALGQGLLAREGARELAHGARAVVYFAPTSLGRAASLSFAVTSTARAALTIGASASTTTATLAILPIVVQLLATIFARRDRDTWIGGALCVSALVLGLTLLARGAWIAALAPLGYAALLVLGVLSLRPSVAERLNILVFGSGVILGGV